MAPCDNHVAIVGGGGLHVRHVRVLVTVSTALHLLLPGRMGEGMRTAQAQFFGDLDILL